MIASIRSQGLRLQPPVARLVPRSVSAAPAPKRAAPPRSPTPAPKRPAPGSVRAVPRVDPDEPRLSGIARLVELGMADDALSRALTTARLTRLGIVK